MPSVRHSTRWIDGTTPGEGFLIRPLSGGELHEARERVSVAAQRSYLEMISGMSASTMAAIEAQRSAKQIEKSTPDPTDPALYDGDVIIASCLLDWRGVIGEDTAEVMFSADEARYLDADSRDLIVREVVKLSVRTRPESNGSGANS